ncbi:MAG: GNAT family N-acetyltransferase [Clostridia bacterium]|nr:GNAT family N-acetyltransferase [Clostridia bacterium]
MADAKKIAPFFEGWDDKVVLSYLQGHMGQSMADDEENPRAAQIWLGDFCYFAGRPDAALVQKAAANIIVPRDEAWASLIETVWGGNVRKSTRYAIKKEPDAFDREKLTAFTKNLPAGCVLRLFDGALYDAAMAEAWSKDFCAQFEDKADFCRRGIGVGALQGGTLVAGASCYCIYNGGIEIEIGTRPDFRRRGLAAACGARLILECLHRGLYPNWDAVDLRSVAVAEKLGYHRDKPYTVYIKEAAPARG